MSIFWEDILEHLNMWSKILQSLQIYSVMVIEIYQSLTTYVNSIWTDEMFVGYRLYYIFRF